MSLAEPPSDTRRLNLWLKVVNCKNHLQHPAHEWSQAFNQPPVRCQGRKEPIDPMINRTEEPPFVSPVETDVDYIVRRLLVEIEERMLRSAKEYGPKAHRDLGIRGQYADMYRKWIKLRRAMWDGEDTTEWREKPREIILDLIGHSLLTVAMIDREGAGDGEG